MTDEILAAVALGVILVGSVRLDWGDGWAWPLPSIRVDGRTYPATISDGLGSPRPGGRRHDGVDVDYQRTSRADLVARYPPYTSSGTRGFFAPLGIPVLAARDGRVWSAGRTARGIMVVLDHGRPWSTLYQHLDSTTLARHARGLDVATGAPTLVRRGDVIGTMGADPMQGATAFRHLHFETHHKQTAVDPSSAMASWARPGPHEVA